MGDAMALIVQSTDRASPLDKLWQATRPAESLAPATIRNALSFLAGSIEETCKRVSALSERLEPICSAERTESGGAAPKPAPGPYDEGARVLSNIQALHSSVAELNNRLDTLVGRIQL